MRQAHLDSELSDRLLEKKQIAQSLLDPDTYQILGQKSGSGLDGDTGTFRMGDKWVGKKEVTLSLFGMQKLLISNAQFQLFDDPYALEDSEERERFGSGDQPAVDVNWYDAFWFSRFVDEVYVNNQPYRVTLPTEAQWEYSARAGSEGDYLRAKGNNANGEKIIEVSLYDLHEYAHFYQGVRTRGTLPVTSTSKFPNLWGLWMAGNAWQWILDAWSDSLRGGHDPLVTGGRGSYRVNRGGGWGDEAAGCRSASRSWDAPGIRDSGGGFRLALSSSGVEQAGELQTYAYGEVQVDGDGILLAF